MGYTHYYSRSLDSNDPELYEVFRRRFIELVKLAETEGLKVADGLGEKVGAWQADGERVSFNGYGDESCETFSFSQIVPKQPDWRENEKIYFDFTKTAYRPYDYLVCATLMLIKDVYGSQVSISSDGGWDDWLEGRALFLRAFGYSLEQEKLFADEFAFLAGR